MKFDDLISTIDQLSDEQIDDVVDWQMTQSLAAKREHGGGAKRAQCECLPMAVGKRHLTVKSLVSRHGEAFRPPRHGHVAGHVNAGHGHANRVPPNLTEASPTTRAWGYERFCVSKDHGSAARCPADLV